MQKIYTMHKLKNLNHHFQTVKNDTSEDIEETISTIIRDILASWIREQTQIC